MNNDSSLTIEYEWLNTDEAAVYLKIPLKTMYNMTSNGYIPFYKLGRRNRYRKDDLDELLLSKRLGKECEDEIKR